VKADRDFVLEWEPEKKDTVSAALFSEDKGADRYMLLMLLPPALTEQIEPVPREMIFVLDTSGSMAGPSLIQAKNALSLAISRLQPKDRFNVIEFNSTTHSLFDAPRPAESSNVAAALHFVSGLNAQGGTEIAPALRMALDGRNDHDRVRQVVFLTDGSVGNEAELFTLIRDLLGDSRLFTIGIGSAPNSYFMTRAASMGRGTYTFIGKVEEVKEKMTNLFRKLEHPVVSNLALTVADSSRNGLAVFPEPLPDLYDGEPIMALIQADQKNAELHLTGMRAGRFQQIAIDTTHFAKRSGIAALWARKKIRNEMESLHLGADKEQVRKTVLATALEHHLVSDFTSLVAVEQQIARPAEKDLAVAHLKTNLPQGWQHDKVFGGAAKTATPSELLIILGFFLLLLALFLAKDRKER
jgi:Ca-activated chloride channel homolog